MTAARCQVAILAGGQGTRLATRSGNLPKPMVPVMGKPLLQHQIEACRAHGLIDIALLVHYRHEAISSHFGDGSAFGVRLRYEIESEPRGTSGALRDALPVLADRFLVLYGDTYFDVDLGKLLAAHERAGASGTLFLHPNDHPQDSDLMEIDGDGSVRAISAYPHDAADRRNLVNAALYVLERAGLEDVTPEQGRQDIAKHMFPAMLAAGRTLHGYVSCEYIKDMGTPERLDKVERDIEAGLPERLSGREPRRAVFLDRDGTLNREVGHLREPSQLELLDGVGAAVRRLNRSGTLAIVTTNQPVIARGDVSIDGLSRIHARLESLLGEQGAYLDHLYFCPHHPDRGFAGEVTALKIRCECRKPLPGMIDTACRELHIGRNDSWMVGDTTADIEAGRLAGVRTILLRSGWAGRDGKAPLRPDYEAPDLAAAVDWILEGHARACRATMPVAIEAQYRRLVLVGGLARSGKSSTAQVLKESLAHLGRTAHVVSLDGWLIPAAERREGSGVLARFDVAAATAELLRVAHSPVRTPLVTRVYDRRERAMHALPIARSIGAQDVLIVEGVPALLMTGLAAFDGALKVHVEAPESVRLERLQADYEWRGMAPADISAMLASRAADEVPQVDAGRAVADHVIAFGDLS